MLGGKLDINSPRFGLNNTERKVSVMDYITEVTNKPSINGVTIEGNMEITDIGIVEMPTEMISEIFLETFGFIL